MICGGTGGDLRRGVGGAQGTGRTPAGARDELPERQGRLSGEPSARPRRRQRLLAARTVEHFLAKADLVFGIGTSFTRSKFIAPIPEGKTIAQVTLEETDISKDYPTSYGVIGDAKAVITQMIAEVKARLRRKGPPGGRGGGGGGPFGEGRLFEAVDAAADRGPGADQPLPRHLGADAGGGPPKGRWSPTIRAAPGTSSLRFMKRSSRTATSAGGNRRPWAHPWG